VLLLALASVATVLPGLAQVPANPLPLRIGASQTGGNGFRGEIAAVRLYDRVLDAAEITRLAAAKPAAGAGLPGLMGEWIFSGNGDSLLSRACPIGGHFRKKFRTGFFASGDRDDIFQK
jgi:hypothetical protein